MPSPETPSPQKNGILKKTVLPAVLLLALMSANRGTMLELTGIKKKENQKGETKVEGVSPTSSQPSQRNSQEWKSSKEKPKTNGKGSQAEQLNEKSTAEQTNTTHFKTSDNSSITSSIEPDPQNPLNKLLKLWESLPQQMDMNTMVNALFDLEAAADGTPWEDLKTNWQSLNEQERQQFAKNLKKLFMIITAGIFSAREENQHDFANLEESMELLYRYIEWARLDFDIELISSTGLIEAKNHDSRALAEATEKSLRDMDAYFQKLPGILNGEPLTVRVWLPKWFPLMQYADRRSNAETYIRRLNQLKADRPESARKIIELGTATLQYYMSPFLDPWDAEELIRKLNEWKPKNS